MIAFEGEKILGDAQTWCLYQSGTNSTTEKVRNNCDNIQEIVTRFLREGHNKVTTYQV